jgi:hypothetical protein
MVTAWFTLMSECLDQVARATTGATLNQVCYVAQPAETDLDRRVRLTVWRMRRLLGRAGGDGSDDGDLVTLLHQLSQHSGEIEAAVVVWLRLIEVLVQDTERRHGSAPGRGKMKAAEVEDVIRYLLRERWRLPPDLEVWRPIIVDVVADWSIASIVQVVNRYDLWVDVTPSGRQPVAARLVAALGGALRILVRPLAALANRLSAVLHPPRRLRPELEAAILAVVPDGGPGPDGGPDLLGGVLSAVRWAGTHRPQVLAGVELVFSAVNEAETYVSMSGPEKKAYARALVLAVLGDLSTEDRTGLLFAIIYSLTGSFIEAAVDLFHRRGAFVHRRGVPI